MSRKISESARKDLIALLEARGPSGYESEATAYWSKRASKYADKVVQDVHNNCHAILNKGGSPVIMVAAHIDEIGFIIRSIDDSGYIRLLSVGGWDSQIVQGQRVDIMTAKGTVKGVIGKKPIHLLDHKDMDNVVKIRDMWVDIGAKDGKAAKKLVEIGDPIVIDAKALQLGKNMIASKSCDNRVGAFVALEALKRLSKVKDLKPEVHFVATVQEEIGLYGAITGAYNVHPHAAFIVDGTFATDCPESDSKMAKCVCGKGPVLMRGCKSNHELFKLTKETAKKSKRNIQIEACGGDSWTDTDVIQISRGGVATLLISVPMRYMHSPVEMFNTSDAIETAALIANVIPKINSKVGFIKKAKAMRKR